MLLCFIIVSTICDTKAYIQNKNFRSRRQKCKILSGYYWQVWFAKYRCATSNFIHNLKILSISLAKQRKNNTPVIKRISCFVLFDQINWFGRWFRPWKNLKNWMTNEILKYFWYAWLGIKIAIVFTETETTDVVVFSDINCRWRWVLRNMKKVIKCNGVWSVICF